MESLERYRDKKRRRLCSGAKTIRYEKRKVNADRRYVQSAEVHVAAGTILDMKQFAHSQELTLCTLAGNSSVCFACKHGIAAHLDKGTC